LTYYNGIPTKTGHEYFLLEDCRIRTSIKHISILTLVLFCIFIVPAYAEVKVFEKEVEEAVSRGQSQEQVEAFALQKAKRLAVEEAGTYISSLTVVQNYQLQKDEVTALASGVVQARIVGVPAVRVENGVVHVAVKARIDVDTSVLDRQIQAIMKEKGTLKKLEAERKKNKELEEKLANLKSSEVKRLEELNAQAIALERTRDKQRLFREEQVLKARGELSRAEAERIAKEREMQERINRTLAAQERAKREEAAAIVPWSRFLGTMFRISYGDSISRKGKTSTGSQRRRSGSMPHVRAVRQNTALATTPMNWARMPGMKGIPATEPTLSAGKIPTPGGSTTCTATSGSGFKTGKATILLISLVQYSVSNQIGAVQIGRFEPT